MKFKKIFVILVCLFLVTTLTSCEKSNVHHDISEYILQIPYKDDFKILQLSDIHMGNKDNQQLHFDFMQLTIDEATPDFIIVTGDIFTFADKITAKRVFAFLDKQGVPWSVTFGNHDEQCYFSIDWMTNYLNRYGKNCKFIDIQDDDVTGNANFAINLMDGSTIKEQLIIMDSNRYNYGEYIGYDYIKQDQIDWYDRLVKYTKEQNGGVVVPSILFFHIPLPEFADAWNAVKNGELVAESGEWREKECNPEYNSGFYAKIQELGSSKAIVVGHDHVNNYNVLYNGIYMCYGVKSTDRVYYDENVLGGNVITVKADNTLQFNQIYHKYEEVK